MEVRFQNFRCFKDTGPIPIRPVTILVGGNSSGKTSFLAGLNHLFGLLEGAHVDLNTPPFELGSFKDIVFQNSKGGRKHSFSYQYFSENLAKTNWNFENDKGDTKLVGSSIESAKDEFFSLSEDEVKIRLSLDDEIKETLKSLGIEVRKKRLKDVYEINIDQFGGTLKRRLRNLVVHQNIFEHGLYLSFLLEGWIERLSDRINEGDVQPKLSIKPHSIFLDFDRRLRRVIRHDGRTRQKFRAFAPIRETPQRVYLHESSFAASHDYRGVHTATKLMKLSQGKTPAWDSLKQDLEKFGQEAGLFESIIPHPLISRSQYPFEIRLKTQQGRTSNLCDVGYGVSQILPLLVDFLLSKENSGFLVQQPEVHLHPKAQAEFGTLIANLATKGRSFVVETHSDFILERIGLEIKMGNLKKENVVILFFDPQEPEVVVHPIVLSDDGSPLDAPPSYRAFFLEEFDRLWS